MIRVVLPPQLQTLAHCDAEVQIDVEGHLTQRTLLDALEARYPMLAGTVRDRDTQRRRAYLRIYGCQLDLSHESPDSPLPAAVADGQEPLLVIGAISGG